MRRTQPSSLSRAGLAVVLAASAVLPIRASAATRAASAPAASTATATDAAANRPRLVDRDGHHALMVDGAPFVILGAQVHNSSNYPEALRQVWPAVHDAHANTAVVPVAWEQVEPVEGHFDFSFVDTLVAQARQNQKRLVLLWFGTWKNTSPQYTPEWVKTDNTRFPRMVDRDGKYSYCLSPFGEETMRADRRAFVELMKHLRQIDEARHTVLMVQVENEVGTYGLVRDFGAKAQAAFDADVPAVVLQHKKPAAATTATGSWRAMYGAYADEYFHAWAIARYIEEIAKAGREAYDLPMYVNNALRNPLGETTPWNNDFASGGPTFDVIDIYKAAAPHVDIAGPDLYNPEHAKVTATLDRFQRADNALMVPEMSSAESYARYVYLTLGRGAIGSTTFGIDYADYSNFPLGSKFTDERMVKPLAQVYAAFEPMQRPWARWAFEGLTHGVAEGDDHAPQTVMLANGWKAVVSFREWQFGESAWPSAPKEKPPGTEQPVGGVAIAQLGDDEFVIVGQHARVRIEPVVPSPNGHGTLLARAEEGRFAPDGHWVMERNWNGDQVDWGLNLTARPVVLKVRMTRY